MRIDSNSIIGIVGAGIMGRGIAQVAAKAGHKVVITSYSIHYTKLYDRFRC